MTKLSNFVIIINAFKAINMSGGKGIQDPLGNNFGRTTVGF